MNNYFINVTKTLNLKKQLGVRHSGVNEFRIKLALKWSMRNILKYLPENFKFQLVSNNKVKKEIENLDTKKSSTYGSIPATILKQYINAYLTHPMNPINYFIQHSSFLQELRLSEVILVYKKLDPLLQKENYRPVSLLPHVSKVFEKIIHKQITNYIRVWINFTIVIREKNVVLKAAGVWGSCDYPSAAGPGQSHAGGPGKFDFYCSKGHTLAYNLIISHVKFSAVWGIFV